MAHVYAIRKRTGVVFWEGDKQWKRTYGNAIPTFHDVESAHLLLRHRHLRHPHQPGFDKHPSPPQK
jgi:hypothetical protein